MSSLASLTPAVRCLERPLSRGELHEVARWSGMADSRALAETFPQIYASPTTTAPSATSDSVRHYVVWKDGRMVSHAVARRVTLLTSTGPVRATLLGSVATDPAYRRRGLSSSLIQSLLTNEAEVSEIAVLWSKLHRFYARLGFEPRGDELRAAVRGRPSCAGVRRASSQDLPRILELHQQKPWRVERSRQEQQLLLTASPMQTFVLADRSDRVAAYACLGKGIDLPNHWHELGGNDADVARLLPTATLMANLAEATVLSPAYRKDLNERLRSRGHIGCCALVRPLSSQPHGELYVDGLDSI